MKIVLGTANFFEKYGISKKKINDKKKIEEIFNFIKIKKIKYIDTAFTYKFANSITAKLKLKGVNTITKVKLPKRNKKFFLENLEKNLRNNLKIFHQKKFDTILLHDVYDIKKEVGEKFLKLFINLKKKNLTKNLGASIYEIKDFNFIIKKFKPDIVQFPVNIFDQRFLEKNFLSTLSKNKIKSQARSIFLQGLILNDKKSKAIFKKYNQQKYLNNFHNLCQKHNITKKEACLFFIKKQKKINYLTIGIENLKQLKQDLAILRNNKLLNFKNLSIKNKNIIDPRKW